MIEKILINFETPNYIKSQAELQNPFNFLKFYQLFQKLDTNYQYQKMIITNLKSIENNLFCKSKI